MRGGKALPGHESNPSSKLRTARTSGVAACAPAARNEARTIRLTSSTAHEVVAEDGLFDRTGLEHDHLGPSGTKCSSFSSHQSSSVPPCSAEWIPGKPARAGHGRDDDDEIQGLRTKSGRVRGGVRPAVDIGLPLYCHWREVAGHGARGRHREAQGHLGVPALPNTTRRPSERRTAHTHISWLGHWSLVIASRDARCCLTSRRAGPSSDMAAGMGRNAHGLVTARWTIRRPGSEGVRRSRSWARKGSNCGDVEPKNCSRILPSGDRGARTVHAASSLAGTPPRSREAVIDPADVPTMTSAVRGSHRRSCSNAARTPA